MLVPVHSSWSRFHRPPSLDHFAWPVGFLMVEEARLALILACYPASPLDGARPSFECVSGQLFLTAF